MLALLREDSGNDNDKATQLLGMMKATEKELGRRRVDKDSRR